MDIPCSGEEKELIRIIARAAENLNMPAYLIGGYVRDKILNRPTEDLDIVCGGDGIALARETARILGTQARVSVFKNFGTAHFRYRGMDLEFVGARKESYRPDSRKPEVEAGSLEDDQRRRDFTINSLGISLEPGEGFGRLIDPFDGMEDLKKGIIRTPLDPEITFSDDPLRMMRAVRFASQLQFRIDEVTEKALLTQASRLRIVSQERITEELHKIILSPRPSLGLDLLFRTGLLAQFFPQFARLHGVETRQGKSHKDNFYHTLQVLDNVAQRSDNLWLRWAAILHDIGKPATKKFDPHSGWTFHGHEVVGERMVPKIFAQLKLPLNEKMKYVAKLVALHLRPISLTKEEITDSAMRRLLFDAGEDLEDLMILCESDITTRNKLKLKRYLENFSLVKKRLEEVEKADQIRNWQPPVDGNEIMSLFSLPPSREVGLLKTALREAILDGIIPQEREACLDFLRQKAQEWGIS